MTDLRQVLTGDEAYSIMTRREETTVVSLLAELTQMAKRPENADRPQQLRQTKQWRMNHRVHADCDNQATSFLRTLSEALKLFIPVSSIIT